jgi:glucose/arabinose dehydrogenase
MAGGLLPSRPELGGVDSTGERGLIGLALHPDFANNGYVYVHYTTNVMRVHNRISRFQAAPPSANVAAVGEVFIIDDLPTLGPTNHNGGAMHFGIDGKLYVGVGDNAVGTNSQDPNSPLGKLLRLNDNGSIPSDNPFTGRTGLARAIWASGLRNPFTFAVQPGSGRIHINDVGENTWEEINLGAAGANYGWPGSEGPDNLSGGVTAPLFAYKHNATTIPGTGPGGFLLGQSIAGGVFYPTAGPFPSELRGNYFFADFVTRFVGVIDMANGNAAYTFANLVGQPVDMRVGLDGALYVLTRNAITQITAP